jgi:PIN domain nuclease of toxin-antitoxin system
MRILLDTHILLWAVGMSARLPKAVRKTLEDPENEVFYSAASLWEIAIKSGLGRRDFQIDPGQILEVMPETGFLELPVRARHAAEVVRLPPLHKDPFDRILVAQSRVEPMILLTNDGFLVRYSDGVRLVQ